MTSTDDEVPAEVKRIAALQDPFAVLRAATRRMAQSQREVTELARLRRRVIQDLHAGGLSYAQIADAAGLSRGRIHQLRHAGPAPEGAFLGIGQVRIATPLKQEARGARPVVAVEDFTAAQRLADLARAIQLEVKFEHIPLDGSIDLKRPNLIIICGPRLSHDVADVLARDPVLRFEQAPDGPWTLRDLKTGEQYRSGSDSTPARPWDAAYLGRLPRPDEEGSVLIFTGIHPPGTLGVVHLLASELTNLYEQVGTGAFSVLLGVEYDPASHEPINVQFLTPLYTHTKE
jgi:hypothetical protein